MNIEFIDRNIDFLSLHVHSKIEILYVRTYCFVLLYTCILIVKRGKKEIEIFK